MHDSRKKYSLYKALAAQRHVLMPMLHDALHNTVLPLTMYLHCFWNAAPKGVRQQRQQQSSGHRDWTPHKERHRCCCRELSQHHHGRCCHGSHMPCLQHTHTHIGSSPEMNTARKAAVRLNQHGWHQLQNSRILFSCDPSWVKWLECIWPQS